MRICRSAWTASFGRGGREGHGGRFARKRCSYEGEWSVGEQVFPRSA